MPGLVRLAQRVGGCDMAIVTGDNGNNNLFGFDAENDQLLGLGGNDLLFSSRGDDTMDGGADYDVALYELGNLFNGVFINNTDTAIGTVLAHSVDKRGFGTDTLVDVENFHGSGFGDVIYVGGLGGTYTFDRAGDDLVVASQDPGADGHLFIAGSGNDTLIGTAADNDRIDYLDDGLDGAGAVSQGVNVDLAAGVATDGWGDTDTLEGIERVHGTPFDDTIVGGDERNQFDGREGNDILDGGGGDRDKLLYTNDPGAVNVNLTTGIAIDGWGDTDTISNFEQVRGSNLNDTLVGDGNRNTFEGEAGDDLIQGLDGDDELEGDQGNDTLDGGADFDTVAHFDDPSGVLVDLAIGSTTDGWGNTDTLISIEGADGSVFGDTLRGDDGGNFLDGREGDDLLEGRGGRDTFRGSQGNDTIDGGDGDDRVEYQRDADRGGPAGVTVDLAAGTATDGFGNTDTLIDIEDVRGTDQADVIAGNDADNDIQGLAGDDLLQGGAGRDFIEGGAGNDTIDGGDNPFEFSGGDAASYRFDHEEGGSQGILADLNAGTVIDTFGDTDTLIGIEEIRGSVFDDTITGGTGDEQLRGEDGNDSLVGGDGNDDISGGAGNDTLTGGVGGDFLQPGTGVDIVDGGANGPLFERDELSYYYDSRDEGATEGVTVTFANATDGSVVDYGGDTDTFTGIERVRGTNNADLFVGAEGDQEFTGMGGDDTFDGGAGDRDELSYRSGDDDPLQVQGVVVDMVAGTATDRYGDTDTFTGIEGIQGSQFGDTITGDGNRNHLRGEDGDDLIDSFGGVNNNLQGGRGNDTIEARGDNDWADGGDGNDLITFYGVDGGANPGLGSDTITGGTEGFFSINYEGVGQDLTIDVALGTTVIGTSGDVDVFTNIVNVGGGDGNDTLLGNDGVRQEFLTSRGDDFIDGRGDANDGIDGDRDWLIYDWFEDDIGPADRAMVVDFSLGTATGVLAGNDTFVNIEAVRTSSGDDLIIGSDQAYEEYQGMDGVDTIQGGGGIDRLSYTFEDNRGGLQGVVVDLGAQTATDTFGNADVISGIEQVIGSDFGDTLTGGADDNLLAGFNGDDVIDGGGGDDLLLGDVGNDTITGGSGADFFGGRIWELDGDTFTDFAFEDRIRVFDENYNVIGANTTVVGDQLEIDITGDGVAEATVTLANGYAGPVISDGGPVGGPVPAVISVANAGLFTAAVQEGDQSIEITLVREGDLFSTASVEVTVTGFGANPADAADVTSPFGVAQTVTFLPGETEATITVDIAEDLDIEATEDLAVTLSGPVADGAAGAELGGAETYIRIVNDDLPAQVSITGEKAQEDSGLLTFTVSRTGDTSQAITVDYEIASAGGLQGAEADDLAGGLPQSGSVVIEAGATEATFDLTIAVDGVAELHDDVVATISAGADWPAGLTVGVAQATGSIRNDDGVPPVLPAGATGSNYGDPHIVTLDGLAYDFQAVGEFTLIESFSGDPLEIQVRFEPIDGSQVASQTTAVATLLGSSRVTVDVSGASLVSVDGAAFDLNSAIGGTSLGDGEIYWDGEAITLVYASGEQLRVDVYEEFLSTSVSIAEGRDVRGLLGNADGDASNDLALRDGTVLAQPVSFSELYTDFANDWRIGSLTSLFDYPDGLDTSDYTDLSFPVAGLSLEDFPVEVVAAAEAAVGEIDDPVLRKAALLDYLVSGDTDYIEAAAQAGEAVTETITETAPTDAPAIPSGIGISVSDAQIVEGDASATAVSFTVYRTGDLSEAVTLDYALGGDADAGDYSGPSGGSLSFAAGVASQTVTVEVTGDTAVEANETLEMSFSLTGGATPVVISSRAAVTIVNDDLTPTGPELNPVTGTGASDFLIGTDGDDLIFGMGGKLDVMFGGEGADVFVFGAETMDGERDRDVILDYEVGQDVILLTEGAEIESVKDTGLGVTVRFEGGKDVLYISGDGVDADSITFVTDDTLLA